MCRGSPIEHVAPRSQMMQIAHACRHQAAPLMPTDAQEACHAKPPNLGFAVGEIWSISRKVLKVIRVGPCALLMVAGHMRAEEPI